MISIIKNNWKTILGILAVIAFVLFLLTGCASSKLISSTTTSSTDTNITTHTHQVIPKPVYDNPLPQWTQHSKPVDTLIAHKDSSVVVIEVHNNQGQVIGKVTTRPFIGDATVNIQPDPVNVTDTTIKIKEKEKTTNVMQHIPSIWEQMWDWIKKFFILIIIGLALITAIPIIIKLLKPKIL